MSRILFSLLLFLGSASRLEAQDLKVSRATVPLPEGNVLGVALYEERGLLFVQQTVLSTENHGLVIRFHLQLSSWSLTSRSAVTTRVFDEAPQAASPYPCGRVAVSVTLRRLVLCSAVSTLEVIDPASLGTVGTIAKVDGQRIKDFAIDDQRGRVVVLSSRQDGSIVLASYGLVTGDKQQETRLPISGSTNMILAVSPESGQMAIATNVSARSGDRADVYTCTAESQLACRAIARVAPASQISFFEKQLLIATSYFADNRNKKDCIVTVDPGTGSVSREYCSPSTGVHYAVGVVQNRYVVAFTGAGKRNWLTEENRSVASSFSVWRAHTSQVAGVVEDPVDYGASQNAVRVVGSSSEPMFIAYQRVSNTLALYSIADIR